MKVIAKYWKLGVALVLAIAAAFSLKGYLDEEAEFKAESQQLRTMIASVQASITENMRYTDVQDDLEEASAQVMASRLELYEKFPVEMKEEDQIMYVLYLEKIFGTEITFAFSDPQPITTLRDGSELQGLTLRVNYETTYKGFQDMVSYLSTDSRVTSVQYADIQYDAAQDKATGTVTLLLYLIDSDLEYMPPDVKVPETGKDNIYD